MRAFRSILLIIIAMALLVALTMRNADSLVGYGAPAPDNYMGRDGPESRDGAARCPDRGGGFTYRTGAGSDKVVVGPDDDLQGCASARRPRRRQGGRRARRRPAGVRFSEPADRRSA